MNRKGVHGKKPSNKMSPSRQSLTPVRSLPLSLPLQLQTTVFSPSSTSPKSSQVPISLTLSQATVVQSPIAKPELIDHWTKPV